MYKKKIGKDYYAIWFIIFSVWDCILNREAEKIHIDGYYLYVSQLTPRDYYY